MGVGVSGCHINVCMRRRAAAPTPASQEPHRESPHCAPWPAWGERLPQGSSTLRPGSPSPTSQRSFETWISLEPLPPLSQGLPERKWGGHALFLGRKDLHLTPPCILRGPSTADPLLHFQLLSPVPRINVFCHLARASLHLGPLPVVPSLHPSAPPSTLFNMSLESHNCPRPWSAWSLCQCCLAALGILAWLCGKADLGAPSKDRRKGGLWSV